MAIPSEQILICCFFRMNANETAMREAIGATLARTTGFSPADLQLSLRPPLDHQSNRLYDARTDGQRLIVKEFLKPDELEDAPVREFRALELLAPLDIAPRPVHYQPAAPPLGPLVIYQFLEGRMWDRRRPGAEELAALAGVWLKMNAAAPADGLWLSRGHGRSLHAAEATFRARFQTYANWVEAEFPPGRQAVDLCRSTLDGLRPVADELADREPLLCFSRADPRFANVIRRPDGRLGLVDWEDSGLRDPAMDLADLVTHPNQEDLLSPRQWEVFLRPYLAVRGELDPGLRRRMHLYLAAFPVYYLSVLLVWGVELASAGRLAGWTANTMPAEHRLRRFLARALAWPEMDFARELETVAEVRFFSVE